MKYITIILLVFAILFLIACKKAKPNISITPNSFLVDVRTPGEFSEGSVPNAVNIPLNEVETRLDEFKNKDNIVVFCRSGGRSGQAKKILETNGISNVQNGGSWGNVKDKVGAN